jgi:arginase
MKIDIIGAPLDFGAGRRGVDMGPSAIRYAGLKAGLEALGHEVRDLGNVDVPIGENCVPGDDPRLKYLDPIIQVEQELVEVVSKTVAAGRIPLVLGGDHSLSIGSIAGVLRGGRSLGLIWLDTHGDFNTAETTPSGNIHGMPLAALCGYGDSRLTSLDGLIPAGPKLSPSNVVVVGARHLDAAEKELMREAGITVFSMPTIDRFGIGSVMERAVEIASRGTEGIYVSFDLDVVDPADAPGVGTAVPGGLNIREAHLAVEHVAATGLLAGIDLVEVNPILDRANMTAELAVELALSAFGKKIWYDEGLDLEEIGRL